MAPHNSFSPGQRVVVKDVGLDDWPAQQGAHGEVLFFDDTPENALNVQVQLDDESYSCWYAASVLGEEG